MSQRLYVGNLPFSATEGQLTELFSRHGEVTSASIVKDRMTDRPRGFGFVEMTSDESAAAAIAALTGQPLDGRALTVNVALPRSEGDRSGRGNGGARRNSGW